MGDMPNDTTIPLTLEFKNTLNSPSSNPLIVGLTRENADSVMIYIVYNDGVRDRKISLTAKVQDCSCCGAHLNSNTDWKVIMCYNLGVTNYDADPFSPAQDLHGDKYKWGTGEVALSAADDQNSDAAIPNWTTDIYGGVPPTGTADWVMTGATNPCPAGYRVPTKDEWTNVNTYNAVSRPVGADWTPSTSNYTSGMYFGNSLFLPAAGSRDNSNGALNDRGSNGYYWSSTYNSTSAYILYFYSGGVYPTINGYRSSGFSVRCMAD